MKTSEIKQGGILRCVLALLLMLTPSFTPAAWGQATNAPSTRLRSGNIQAIPSGAKMKFRGVVMGREADTFTVRDRNRTDYQVLLTDTTSIKTYGGFLRFGKKYAVADILRGLIVEVEGRGNVQGQLAAEKVRFEESDMRAAVTTDTRVKPVEDNQERLAGQIDELHAIAAEARTEVRAANERISALDDYDMQETVTVNFALNSAVLSLEARQRLDALAQKAMSAKSYLLEVAGHTDATGNEGRNFVLSQQRADAVMQYLAVQHKVPTRRFVSPMGYGKTAAVADNKSAAGRAQNRRVEVKMLLNRGMSRQPAAATTVRQE